MIKFLWIDTETTGLDPVNNDIIQIAGIIEIPGIQATEFNFKVAPLNYLTIDQEALNVNKITINEMKTFESPKKVHTKFKKLLFNYVSPYDPLNKLILCGQNVQFDSNMLREFCIKQNDLYWNALVTNGHFDLKFLSIALEVFVGYKIFDRYNLSDICKKLKVNLLHAHDAMHDIKATRECCIKIWNFIQKGQRSW